MSRMTGLVILYMKLCGFYDDRSMYNLTAKLVRTWIPKLVVALVHGRNQQVQMHEQL